MRDAWSIDQIEQLKKLWREGKTAVAIGAALGGLSRSAVLGKVFRLRLGPAKRQQLPRESRRAPPDTGSPTRRRGAQRRNMQPPTPASPPKARGMSLLELTNTSCRWPHGRPGTDNFHFCGANGANLENGVPYCEPHMRRAYAGSSNPEKANRPLITAVSTLTGAWTNGLAQCERLGVRSGRGTRS